MRRISGTSHRVITERTPLGHMAEGVLSVWWGGRNGRYYRQETPVLLRSHKPTHSKLATLAIFSTPHHMQHANLH
jgi:hypothetical protein